MNRVHPARGMRAAERLMDTLGISWVSVATLRLGQKRDPIANQLYETYGAASHFINARGRCVASYVQEPQALIVYDRSKAVGKIFYKQLNVRKRI